MDPHFSVDVAPLKVIIDNWGSLLTTLRLTGLHQYYAKFHSNFNKQKKSKINFDELFLLYIVINICYSRALSNCYDVTTGLSNTEVVQTRLFNCEYIRSYTHKGRFLLKIILKSMTSSGNLTSI